jgi:hypothetical protein
MTADHEPMRGMSRGPRRSANCRARRPRHPHVAASGRSSVLQPSPTAKDHTRRLGGRTGLLPRCCPRTPTRVPQPRGPSKDAV